MRSVFGSEIGVRWSSACSITSTPWAAGSGHDRRASDRGKRLMLREARAESLNDHLKDALAQCAPPRSSSRLSTLLDSLGSIDALTNN
jgi:hypothetical protein